MCVCVCVCACVCVPDGGSLELHAWGLTLSSLHTLLLSPCICTDAERKDREHLSYLHHHASHLHPLHTATVERPVRCCVDVSFSCTLNAIASCHSTQTKCTKFRTVFSKHSNQSTLSVIHLLPVFSLTLSRSTSCCQSVMC